MTDENDIDHNIGIGFHYDDKLVKMGYTLYRNSHFSSLPTPEELLRYDQAWLDDIQAMHQFVESKRPPKEEANGQPSPLQFLGG